MGVIVSDHIDEIITDNITSNIPWLTDTLLDAAEEDVSDTVLLWFLQAVIGRLLRGGPPQHGATVMGLPSPWQPDLG